MNRRTKSSVTRWLYHLHNILPFATKKIWPAAKHIDIVGSKFWPKTILTHFKLPKTCKISPHWQTFAKSVHTDEEIGREKRDRDKGNGPKEIKEEFFLCWSVRLDETKITLHLKLLPGQRKRERERKIHCVWLWVCVCGRVYGCVREGERERRKDRKWVSSVH